MDCEWVVSFNCCDKTVPSLSHLQNQVDLFCHYMMTISHSIFWKYQTQQWDAQRVANQSSTNTLVSTSYVCQLSLPWWSFLFLWMLIWCYSWLIHGILEVWQKAPTNITITSVSMVQTSILFNSCSSACSMCTISLVSASSWLQLHIARLLLPIQILLFLQVLHRHSYGDTENSQMASIGATSHIHITQSS